MRELVHLIERESAAVAGSNQCSNAGASDDTDRNIFLFQNFEDTDMRDAAGKASAQGDANGWDGNCRRRNGFAGEFSPERLHGPNDLPETVHLRTPRLQLVRPGLLNPYLNIKMPYFPARLQSTNGPSARTCNPQVTITIRTARG